jgi:nucleobase:cation symporter-1, NCS1 family
MAEEVIREDLLVGETEVYEVFKVEQRGIEIIPSSDRHMTPFGLFWLWAGAIWNVEYLVYGALMLYFGLSFGQAVAAILIGNLVYALLGLASLMGPEGGTTQFMVSRAPFGRNGNRLPSLFNWVTQVGFEIEGIVLVVLVIEAMFSREGTTLGTGAKWVVIILAVMVQFLLPYLGHATITKVLRYLSFVFIVVFVIMAILVIPHAHPSHLHQSTSWWLWTTGLVLIVSAGGLGWTENASDYSRYLPSDTPKSKTFWAATLGAGIPSILLELLGATAYLVAGSNATAVTGLPAAFASWFFWPFLILALPQLFAINTMDLYSSGVTLQAIGLPLKRWGCVLVDTIVAGAVTALVIFKGHFYADLSGFLDYIVVWISAWFGILFVDYLLRRGHYDSDSIVAPRGGLYSYQGGVNWKGIFSLALGMVAALMWTDAQFYQPPYYSPLSSATHGADFSWLFGFAVSSLAYWILCTSDVRRQLAEEGVMTRPS